jgi:hypothetical protein
VTHCHIFSYCRLTRGILWSNCKNLFFFFKMVVEHGPYMYVYLNSNYNV